MRALLDTIKKNNLSKNDTVSLLLGARRFGQVIFTSGEDQEEENRVEMLRAFRSEIVAYANGGGDFRKLHLGNYRGAAMARLMGEEPATFEFSVEQRGKFLKDRMGNDRDALRRMCADMSAPSIYDFMSTFDLYPGGRDIYNEPEERKLFDVLRGDEVERALDEAACTQAGSEDGERMGDMDAEGVERRLKDRGESLCRRFGLKSIRIGGFPTDRAAEATLVKLEKELSEMARLTKDERSVGREELTIHARATREGAARFENGVVLMISEKSEPGFMTREWRREFGVDSAGVPDESERIAAVPRLR